MYKAKEGRLPDNIKVFFRIKPKTNVTTRQEGNFLCCFEKSENEYFVYLFQSVSQQLEKEVS